MWENVFWGVPNFKPTGVHWQNLVDQNINSMQVFLKGEMEKIKRFTQWFMFYQVFAMLTQVKNYVETNIANDAHPRQDSRS